MSNCRSNVSSFIAIIAYFLIRVEFSQATWTKFELISILDMNGTSSVAYYDVKPKRISRTKYGITGTVTFNDDFNKYMIEVKIYYSASGNGDYVLHPLKKTLTPLCDVCNNEYRNYMMKTLSTTSNLPNSEDEDICPLFKQNTYTITDCSFETNLIPQFLNRGWYRIHMLMYNLDGILSSGVETNMHLH